MSLEKQVAELTVAVNNLAAVFAGTAAQLQSAPVVGEPAPVEEPKPAPKKKAAPKKAEPKPAPKKEEPAPVEEEAKEEAPAEDAISFDEVRTATRELGVARDRETVVALLLDYDVAKASELKPEQYGEYIAKAKSLMATADDLSE